MFLANTHAEVLQVAEVDPLGNRLLGHDDMSNRKDVVADAIVSVHVAYRARKVVWICLALDAFVPVHVVHKIHTVHDLTQSLEGLSRCLTAAQGLVLLQNCGVQPFVLVIRAL